MGSLSSHLDDSGNSPFYIRQDRCRERRIRAARQSLSVSTPGQYPRSDTLLKEARSEKLESEQPDGFQPVRNTVLINGSRNVIGVRL